MTSTSSLDSMMSTFGADKKSHAAKQDRGAKTADFDTFIKLLVTQMKNQDPSEPLDATQYISQLASFSSVEQATQTNKQLGQLGAKLDALLAGNSIMQAGDYVGKYVTNEDGSVSGKVASVKIYSDGLMATLEDGRELQIGAGVSVSAHKIEAGKGA